MHGETTGCILNGTDTTHIRKDRKMACKYCTQMMKKDFSRIGDDMEDGVGEWSMEKLSDGTLTLAYTEDDEVLASLEIGYCPFCGQKLQ